VQSELIVYVSGHTGVRLHIAVNVQREGCLSVSVSVVSDLAHRDRRSDADYSTRASSPGRGRLRAVSPGWSANFPFSDYRRVARPEAVAIWATC
jgi:hypothetical protein